MYIQNFPRAKSSYNMRGIFAEWIFSRTFSRAAFLIKASRPENTFKLSSWTLNLSLLFTRLPSKRETERETKRKKQNISFKPTSFLLSNRHAKYMCMRANNAKREKKTERKREREVHLLSKRKKRSYIFASRKIIKWKKNGKIHFLFVVLISRNVSNDRIIYNLQQFARCCINIFPPHLFFCLPFLALANFPLPR